MKVQPNCSVNSELNKIDTWLRRNKLPLNFSETCYMLINKQPYSCYNSDITLSLRSFALKRERTVQYLGLYIDDCIKWSYHVHHLSFHLARHTGLIYRIKDVVPQHTLCMLSYSLIYSRIQYGLLIRVMTKKVFWEFQNSRCGVG